LLVVRYPGDDGRPREERFAHSPVRVGRDRGNEIVLRSHLVSRYHARVFFNDSEVSLVDASANGTWVDGVRVTGFHLLRGGERIQIGDVEMEIHLLDASQAAAEALQRMRDSEKRNDPVVALKRRLHAVLLEYLDLKRLDIRTLGDAEVHRRARQTLVEIVNERQAEIPVDLDQELLIKEILDEALGLGPLEDFLADEAITEVMVVTRDLIYVETHGKLTLTEKTFTSDDAIRAVIERIVTPLGRRIDESSPLVDARLKDGSRVNAIIPPLAIRGPAITIRKFRRVPLTMEDLIQFGTMDARMARFLQRCVRGRKNMIVSGGTGSGKTTLLNVMSSFIPPEERIVTIEDAAELRLDQEHVVSLETRPPNIEGKGEFKMRDLVRNALRMRPDRIIVGECRGGEALDMLQAMNTGHDGSLTTAHANTPVDLLARLETMVLMAGMELPLKAIRQQISSALNIVVQQDRFSDGSRKITRISEVLGLDQHDRYRVEDIFVFRRMGLGPDGKVLGEVELTGYIPTFIPELVARGVITDGEYL